MSRGLSFEWTFAWRSLFSRRSRRLLHVVSVITIIGVGFGVAALLVTLGVLRGFQERFAKSALAFNAHIIVRSAETIRMPDPLVSKILAVGGEGEIKGLVPFHYREGLAIRGTHVRGLAIKTVDLDRYWELSDLSHREFASLQGEIWLGETLWEELGRPTERLRLYFPISDGDSKGFEDLPIAGVFQSGLFDYDANFALLDRAGGNEAVSGIEVWLQEPQAAEPFRDRLAQVLSFPYTVLTWHDLNYDLFSALKLEKLVFAIIVSLIILVASFNIMGTLAMRVLERRGDIAILRAIGASWRELRRTFFWQGITLSVLGAALGLLLAGGILALLHYYRPLKLAAPVYFVDHVPVAWSFKDVGIVLGITLLFSWLSSELALLRLRRMSVVRALGEA